MIHEGFDPNQGTDLGTEITLEEEDGKWLINAIGRARSLYMDEQDPEDIEEKVRIGAER